MSYLRGSQNYVWSTTSVLGKGATGAVFQGVNKTTGEPVAVKTFNQSSHLRPREVKIREFEVLQKVKHENIVKLLAIEEEDDNKVIVMELCTGGSLFSILDDPENTFGLEEAEFLLVLEHLTAGMKHLRDNNLVHRDLKPGNIMKFIKDDGTTIYKLTDFGAARELQEGEEFKSLYGTEEYLHPDMYERAVLKKPVNKTFGATIDLWSIGVTLYHVATGNLPFRPYGGRRNKETMYHITTKKESGVISGIQTKENGPIDWKRDLPNNCQLSTGLKKIVTPLLAGILERDATKIWSFDMFFSEVQTALARKAVNIFHINKATLIKVYIHPDEVLADLQNYTNEQTNASPENQIMIFRNNLFESYFSESTNASGFPKTSENEPVFLFSRENINVTIDGKPDLPAFKEFPQIIHVENDAAQSKLACSIAHLCKKHIETCSLASKLVSLAIDNFAHYINKKLTAVNTQTTHLRELTNSLEKSTKILALSQKVTKKTLSVNISLQNNTEKLQTLSNSFATDVENEVQQLHKKYAVDNTLKLEWDTSTRMVICPSRTMAPARAKTLVENLRDSWQHLLRDRATRSLTYNDEQFHILEKIKITQTINKIKNLLEKEVFPQFSQLADNLGDWYNFAQTVYLKTKIMEKDVIKYSNDLKDFQDDFAIENEQYSELVQNNLDSSKILQKDTVNKCKNRQNHNLKTLLKGRNILTGEITSILNENTSLMNQINELLEDSSLSSDVENPTL